MKREDEVLGGFSAIFDQFHTEENMTDISSIENDVLSEKVESVVDVDDLKKKNDDEPIIPSDNDIDDTEGSGFDNNIVDTNIEDELIDKSDIEVTQETDEAGLTVAFFDAIAEKAGWTDVSEEEKPKTLEDLIGYMEESVKKSSTPNYSNETIAELDEFVRNGGKIEDYLAITSTDIDSDSIDLSDTANQRSILREFMLEKGFDEDTIERKLDKYEDANILEDEASDALESLKESRKIRKEALLEEQKNIKESMEIEQQKFYNSVVSDIDALNDIRGIKIPKEDKNTLKEYIFKIEPDGKTRYQKDYFKASKNLIESAYFTMKGDALIDSAKRTGETSTVERLRKHLNSSKITSKQTINDGSAEPLWSIASKQLLRRP